MKHLLGLAFILTASVLVQADFVTFLKEIQNHNDFKQLSVDEQVLFYELVMAAETNTLTEFIDRTGLLSVIELIDKLSYVDANKFSAFLAEHLGYHHHQSSNSGVLQKRSSDGDVVRRKRKDHGDHDDDDFSSILNTHSNYYHSHLTDQERRQWDAMKHAADTNTLTQWIDTNGYGVVFGLIENMSLTESNTFMHFLEAQLQKEATLAATP